MTSSKIRRATLAAALVMVASQATAAPIGFYWTQGWTHTQNNQYGGPAGAVNRVDVGGGNAQVLATTGSTGANLNRVTDVEIDYNSGTVYYTNWDSGNPNASEAIYRMNKDGTGQAVFNATSSSPTGAPSGLHRLAVDSRNGDVYFTRAVSYANPPRSRGSTRPARTTRSSSAAGRTTRGGSRAASHSTRSTTSSTGVIPASSTTPTRVR